jgi:hypothetical protein
VVDPFGGVESLLAPSWGIGLAQRVDQFKGIRSARSAGPSDAEGDEALLVNEMHQVHVTLDDTYGSPRMTDELGIESFNGRLRDEPQWSPLRFSPRNDWLSPNEFARAWTKRYQPQVT